jgi:hypothetical protein
MYSPKPLHQLNLFLAFSNESVDLWPPRGCVNSLLASMLLLLKYADKGVVAFKGAEREMHVAREMDVLDDECASECAWRYGESRECAGTVLTKGKDVARVIRTSNAVACHT